MPSETQIQNEASDRNCLEIVFATNSLVENVHRTVQILTNTDKPRLYIFVTWWVENSNLEYIVMNPCKKFKKIFFKKILGTVYTFGVGSKVSTISTINIEINFWNLSRLSFVSRAEIFFSRSRFLKLRLFQSRLGHVKICIEIT